MCQLKILFSTGRRSAVFILMLAVVLFCNPANPGNAKLTKEDLEKCIARAKARGPVEWKPNLLKTDEAPCAYLLRRYIDRGNVNKAEQRVHGVDEMRAKYHLSGDRITIGLWDLAFAVPTHREFMTDRYGQRISRVVLQNANGPEIAIGPHATHIAGTLGAHGWDVEAEGMAPEVTIFSYVKEQGRNEEFDRAVAAGVTVTNHSYGQSAGWEWLPSYFSVCPDTHWIWLGRDRDEDAIGYGRYDEESASFDSAIFKHPTLSVFVAAGNSRGDASNAMLGVSGFDGRYCMCDLLRGCLESTKPRASLLRKNGYDTIPPGDALSKNAITVGAMTHVAHELAREDVRLTEFSSFGPADDGRIKPDVVADGDRVYSTAPWAECREEEECTINVSQLNAENEFVGYQEMRGTSMATPVAAGIGALLNELALQRLGRTLYADEMKAVLIHAAKSKRADNGPTYDAGWGAIQALRAGALVAGEEGVLERRPLHKGQLLRIPLEWAKDASARITVVWLDEKANVTPLDKAIVDDPTAALKNKIAVTLQSPDGKTTFYPWSLDPSHPENPPVSSRPNKADNVNRFDIAAAERGKFKAGTWFLTIDGSGIDSDQLGGGAPYGVAIAYYNMRPKQ